VREQQEAERKRETRALGSHRRVTPVASHCRASDHPTRWDDLYDWNHYHHYYHHLPSL
jgi:hypothetical protein